MTEKKIHLEVVRKHFLVLTEELLKKGVPAAELKNVSISQRTQKSDISLFLRILYSKKILLVFLLPLLYSIIIEQFGIDFVIRHTLGTRCLIPNNYLIWEFTRPMSTCDYCRGIDSALVLENITKEEFQSHAYSSRPIIVKNAAKHWLASKVFSLHFFKNIYETIHGAYESVEEECQFLHFRSNFVNLREVFAMSDRRALNLPGEDPWYVGWKNCHPQILDIMKKFYEPPHFLPDDAEIPNTNYVFLGYEQGAEMHLDYIPRLMWQGQVLGSKTWTVAPTPECDRVCQRFSFFVDTGDIILLDTRIWYHGTKVENGQFSLTITSEYG